MGRYRRPKFHPQNEGHSWEEDHRRQDHNRLNHQANERPRLLASRPRVDKSNTSSNPFQRTQNPRNPPWIADNTHHDQTTLQVPRHFDHAFVTKSKRLKAYLIRTLNQALVQVEQWYPDNPSDEEMDWQHEEEIVVTQPQEVCYPWDTPCSVGFYSHVEKSGSSGWLALPNEANGEGFGSGRMPCSGRSDGMRKEKFFAYDHRLKGFALEVSFAGPSQMGIGMEQRGVVSGRQNICEPKCVQRVPAQPYFLSNSHQRQRPRYDSFLANYPITASSPYTRDPSAATIETMADYNALKVPDLKKLLGERGLVVSGNKADLIARLQEDDTKKNGATAASGAGEDEIDWDEDDNKAETAPAVAAAAGAGAGVGPAATPIAVPNQVPAIDPSTTTDLAVKQPSPTAPVTSTVATETEATPVVPEEPKKDFTAGLVLSEADKEAAKRAARAKRFGLDKKAEALLTEEDKKLAERAKKFGTDKAKDQQIVAGIVSTLNEGLSEKRPKRGREGGEGERNAKRQTPDQRTEVPRREGRGRGGRGEGRGGGGGGGLKRITDDPTEAAKAEARAKRFAAAK
ncbi:hypothetical protein BUE80_DR004655 [Diplocarpon rosae]|nr:hypothetical protein BUE80_DR004655 [Diplocarpon rosae]